jgi:hypothetical protein
MKLKLLITILLLTAVFRTNAQITLDHQYLTDGPGAAFKLGPSGLKYYSEHRDFNPGPTYFSLIYFTLYNADHSIFKTITIPQIPGKRASEIAFVSETLFDLDTLIEYMLSYENGGQYYDVAVLSENGNTLLYVDSGNYTAGSSAYGFRGFVSKPIFPDGNQTKLYLETPGGINVYNLPGQLPCLECNGGLTAGIADNSNNNQRTSTAFPNPSRNQFTIQYTLPLKSKTAFIEIYDMKGVLVKKSKLNNSSSQVVIFNNELSSGLFIYRIIADDKLVSTDKIIISN